MLCARAGGRRKAGEKGVFLLSVSALPRGAGLGAAARGSASFSGERRMWLGINPANEMSGLVCMSLSPGQGDRV